MTVEEIFSELSAHMIKGLMVHDQMAKYYCFLNLKGYVKCHTYHYLCENKDYMELNHYYHKYHNKLIKEQPVSDPKLIPNSWYTYLRIDIDATTKRNAVKTGLEKWASWEKDTLDLYSKMYQELLSLGEIADAEYLACLIKNVNDELAHANTELIDKKTCDFDIACILGDQEEKCRKYCEKIKKVWR